jgi:dihydroceramidase
MAESATSVDLGDTVSASGAVGAGASNGQSYYWGAPDSLIDWCEPNFVHTPYIAEFYNTITHVPASMYMLVAILVMAFPRPLAGVSGAKLKAAAVKWLPRLELRHQVSVLGLAIVCAGSVLFHATLRYWGQLLDEVPMIIVVGSFLYNLNRRPIRSSDSLATRKSCATFNLRLAIAMIAAIIFNVVSYVWNQWYTFFVASYIIGVLTITFQCAVLAYRGAGIAPGTPNAAERIAYRRTLYYRALGCYGFGSACWIIERSLCPHQPAPFPICRGAAPPLWCFAVPYLHAVWHIFSVAGSYATVLYIALATTPDGSEVSPAIDRRVMWRYGMLVV